MQKNKKEKRLGQEKYNNEGYLMKIVEYIDANNIVVEFQDEYKTKIKNIYKNFIIGGIRNPINKIRLGKEKLNNQGCLMKIVEYTDCNNIVVEFQDKYRTKVHTGYDWFLKGQVKNPYYPSIFKVGIIGDKYKIYKNNTIAKEYKTWKSMLQRCFDEKHKEKMPTYKDVICCEEWLLYENFYEWLHSQENFEQWYKGNFTLDKDILIKGNKLYSPDTCCLVPYNVNILFTKRNSSRGNYPIGVSKHGGKFRAYCNNPFTKKHEFLGNYIMPEQAFYLGYKPYKENIIKQVAQKEYDKGNITRKCYKAMMNYKVEITD